MVFTLLFFVLMGAQSLSAQPNKFSLEGLRRIAGVSNLAPSPDGATVAVVVTRPNYADNINESELYAVEVRSGKARQLTFGRKSAGEPHWSPDGSVLAFLAPDTAQRPQIWLMPMSGGDVRQLTTSPSGVAHFAWRPDGVAIAYAAEDEAPKLEGESRHLTTFQVGDQDIFLRTPLHPQHIWIISTDSAKTERLTTGAWTLEFALPPGSAPSRLSWSPDGRHIAFARVPAPESGKLDLVSVWILDVATKEVRSLNGLQSFQNNPSYSPDGRWVSYWYPRDGRYDLNWVNEVYVAPAEGGMGRNLTRAIDRNFYAAEWMPGGKELLVAANDRASVGLWIQPIEGPARRIDLDDLVINGAYGYEVAVARTGAIFFVATSPDRPAEIYVLDTPAAHARRLTDFNAWAKDITWGKMERVTWKSSDGLDEDGVIVYPPDFLASRSYPLVLNIHGGPTSASKTNFNALAQLMAAEGWLVFMPNYRGSDNLGNSYLGAILGDWGKGPGRDVMDGVTELRKRPYVNKSRTAVTGWSYGGYMTTWLAGNYPNEWRAAVAGAPVTNFEDEYNLSDGNVSWRYSFGGSPWTGDRAAAYREQSPITYATRIKAPTLVMSNIEDFRVPPTQAFALYHALKDNGVETRFMAFGGRTHASADPVNGRERIRLWMDWVKNHLDK